MSGLPPMEGYRPYGVPGSSRESVILLFEEYEAIRLADYENLTQEEAVDISLRLLFFFSRSLISR
jgi:predicted DNA-binding protein (UPF0251 family)